MNVHILYKCADVYMQLRTYVRTYIILCVCRINLCTVHLHMCVHTYVCICTVYEALVNVRTYEFVCMYVHTHSSTFIKVYCINVHIYKYADVYVHVHTYIHICVCSINFMYSVSSYICTYVCTCVFSTYVCNVSCACVWCVHLHAHVNAYLCTV